MASIESIESSGLVPMCVDPSSPPHTRTFLVQWKPFKKNGKDTDMNANRQSQYLLGPSRNSAAGPGGDANGEVPPSPASPSWMIDDDEVPTHPPPHSSPPPPVPAHSDVYHENRQSADASEYYYLVHREHPPV